MRNSLVAAIVASIVGFSANSAAQAAIRRATAIPPQQLTTALRALIDDRELQIVYSSDLLGERRSAGANGELTLDEALTQILSGTGLVYTYLDASTVTILPKQPTASAVTVPSGVSRQERRNWRLASSEAPAPTTQGASGEPAATATSEDGTELYEVIVTAQKRAQKLIDVPISISAVDADTLEALRVEQVGDYIFSIPNATFIDQGAFYGQRVTFRGISDFAGGRFDVTSVLLDDIGFSAMNSAVVLSTGLLDIERIEVLRGPQGTLSGRNSLGGSINIVTAKPQMDAIKGSMTVDVGRFGTQYFKGILNVPLSERVAVRTAAFQSSSDGAMRNVGPAGGSSGTDMFGGRAAVRFLATDKLTIDAAFGYESRKRDFDDLVGHNFNLGAVESVNDNWVNDKLPILESWGGSYPGEISLFNQVGNNGGTVSRDVAEYVNIEDWTASLRASYELDRHTIELLYGHFDYELRFMEDYDQTEYAWWKGYDGVFSQTDSLELRFASDYSGPFNWVAGISQLRESLDSESTDFIGMWAILGGTPRYAGGDGGYRAAYYEQNVNDFRSFGVYANVFWDISPRLHLSAGVRYSRETSDAGGNFIYDETDPNLVLPALTPGDYAANPTLEEFSPRIAFNYDVSKASSVYVQYSTGYRAGYGNSPLSISANAPEAVDPESLRNYEIGFKGRLLDNRLSFSTAVFYMDYTDL
ncbi:TonB-dependent receptor domain-containing protein, partial [Steroidobacter sp.]|uniref:TonB-dependent receptor domain-containing protein n=1 Tax=Steroidobacter sp. TaxID=1978227 RepID=UPI001A5227FB